MQENKKKTIQQKRRRFSMLWIILGVLLLFLLYAGVQGACTSNGLTKAHKRLSNYDVKTAALSYGDVTYLDEGNGEVILSVHGIFGGYDQAYETVKARKSANRLIAPSRFGYLGSDTKDDGSPKAQADAFAELLDFLNIDSVFVLATSAGGTPAIRFALDYPERVKGLILFCSAMPPDQEPESYLQYQAPPKALISDYAMYLISPLFKPLMGLPPSTVEDIQPVSERKAGAILDGEQTNPDMERHFDQYSVESLKMPTLILHAKDDSVASFEKTRLAVPRFPDCTFIAFEDGGHMMAGHEQEINEALDRFLSD
ncbi:MAG: alpha/beta fold hydrolase [Lachnospiraceae bacterium]